MAIHGNTTAGHIVQYVQTGDPGSVGAGVVWIDTTNYVTKVRNAGNTAWVSVTPETLIGSQVLGSGASTITFSSIPGTYDSLRLVVTGRISETIVSGGVAVQFNTDTSAHYADQAMYVSKTTLGGLEDVAATQALIGWLAGASASSNFAGTFVAEIPAYANTTWYKAGISRAMVPGANTTTNLTLVDQGFVWTSTAAITAITIMPATSSKTFITGTIARLYGVKGG